MYHYGGFYMDLDFEALQSLETIGNTHDIVIGQEVCLGRAMMQPHIFGPAACPRSPPQWDEANGSIKTSILLSLS